MMELTITHEADDKAGDCDLCEESSPGNYVIRTAQMMDVQAVALCPKHAWDARAKLSKLLAKHNRPASTRPCFICGKDHDSSDCPLRCERCGDYCPNGCRW